MQTDNTSSQTPLLWKIAATADSFCHKQQELHHKAMQSVSEGTNEHLHAPNCLNADAV